MQNDSMNSSRDILKKLRNKAELCRFCHAALKERYSGFRSNKEFSVVLFSLISAALVGFYYRRVWTGELILSLIFLIPLFTAIVQALDNTVFKWTEKVARHESAVAIWGDWIREADFLEKRIELYSIEVINEKIQNIQDKYIVCMGNTAQIPNAKFLQFKRKFRIQVLSSKKIDEMTLEELGKK